MILINYMLNRPIIAAAADNEVVIILVPVI